jgi:Domain of unknown function (DUF4340)
VVAPEIGVIRRILVLLVLVAGLGAYLYWYEVPKAEREAKKEKLVDVERDAITGVTLDFPDRQIVLLKEDGAWKLTKPLEAPADETAVNALLGVLTGAEVQRTLDELPKDLAPFGLDRPDPTVQLTVATGSVPPIHVGKQTKIGSKTYVRLGDEPKLLLSTSNLKLGLDKQAKDLRDKTLLSFEDDAVQRVEIASPAGQPVVLVRKDGDHWVVEPGDYPADVTEVRSYLSSLRATRAVDFPAEAPSDLAPYGLDAPRLIVTVTMGEGDAAKSQSLSLGGETAEGTSKRLFATSTARTGVVTVGDWSQKNLDKSVGTFRDKTVLAFDPENVGRVELQRREGTGVNVERGPGGAWQVTGKEGSESVAIGRLLEDLHDLRGADVVTDQASDLSAYGLDAPALHITLFDKDGKPLGTVLATKHDGKYYAIREGQPTVFEVRDYMFTRLDKQEKDFLQAPAAPPPSAPAPSAPAASAPAASPH